MMQRIFKIQKITAGIYTIMAVAVFLYTLVFMTEYKDLFGLKLKQNQNISFFHDSVLQTFNRQIFLLALIGILIILFSFLLEMFNKVPDRFALIVMGALLVVCCAGAVYAIMNLNAVEVFYRTLDFKYLELEGLAGYEPHVSTFRVGGGVYLLQIVACVLYGISMFASHITFVKQINGKGGR